ncbi:hypothetical protein NDU88_011516 [Pleurodeles waltl]|uniref:Uncharacterized protein n=1 Tax=Pleurodeles waltl TaxID=8319 RepID=A0AAV7R178_PLEWA|nr:hypothetical protein NDU88_011516 [Pleurodeles waltl]
MGKYRMAKGAQRIQMDRFMAQHPGEGSQLKAGGLPGEVCKPSGAQILAEIKASRQAVQTQIAAIAVDVNLLRTDLRAMALRLYVLAARQGYIGENWNTGQTRGMEWEAFKVVMRGVSIGKVYGIPDISLQMWLCDYALLTCHVVDIVYCIAQRVVYCRVQLVSTETLRVLISSDLRGEAAREKKRRGG